MVVVTIAVGPLTSRETPHDALIMGSPCGIASPQLAGVCLCQAVPIPERPGGLSALALELGVTLATALGAALAVSIAAVLLLALAETLVTSRTAAGASVASFLQSDTPRTAVIAASHASRDRI
jgi:hypothetical protein